ncbi:hypothetical protein ABBQ32_005344 [Trebouxia sp. C0010 RCD-2024]
MASHAPAQLSESDEAAEQRWESLDEAELNTEIDAYKTSLETIRNSLHGLGICPGWKPDHSHLAPLREGSDGNGAGEEGDADLRLGSLDDLHPSEWQVPPHCIPIHANVTTYDWRPLAQATQFDVIMMDPPWQLATANPTRGVALGYSQLTDQDIVNLPVPQLQTNGFLFVWVINAKYKFTLDLFDKWGYKLVDEIVWVKMTVNRRMAKSHGYYLQHAKEVCLVGKKGSDPPGIRRCVGSDVIYSERRGQSQKPEEIYQLIEELVPNGICLHIWMPCHGCHEFKCVSTPKC